MSADEPTPRWELGRGFWPKLGLSLVITAGFVVLLQLGALKLKPSNEALLSVDGWSFVLFFVLFTTMHFIRAARWALLLAPVQRVPLGTVVRVALVGYLAIALLPFRMGEAARPILIRRDAKVNAWAATGTVGAERLIDGLTISVLLLAALRIAPPMEHLPDRIGDLRVPVSIIPNLALGTASMFAAGCVAMGLFYLRPVWAERLTLAVVSPVSKRLARWLATRLADTASGLGFLTTFRYSIPFLFATLFYWLLNAGSWWVLAQGCGLGPIGYFHALAVMCVVALGIVVPATPGFYGAFQLAIYAGLAMYLPPEEVREAGALYAFYGYVLPIGLTVAYGAIAALLRPAPTKVGPDDGSRLAAE
jgi:glycosyltransferase 2 family protein